MEKKVLMRSIGGLGNRLRPILSLLAMGNQVELEIDWRVTRECGSQWDDLFVPLPKYDGRPLEVISVGNAPMSRREGDERWSSFPMQNITVRGHFPNLKSLPNVTDETLLVDTAEWITSPIHILAVPHCMGKILRHDIRAEVLSLKEKLGLGPGIIGCHLRGTDLLERELRAGRDRISDIRRLVLSEKGRRFAVFSEEKEILGRFSSLSHVIAVDGGAYTAAQRPGAWANNCVRSPRATRRALIDLLLLSFCDLEDMRYHSCKGSTFLQMASTIKGWER